MLKSIVFDDNHLGKLKLDFLKSDGSIYKKIVIAGDNGSGKTTILNIISEYMSSGNVNKISSMEYVVDGKSYKATSINKTAENNYHTFITESNGKEVGSVYNYGEFSKIVDRPILRKLGYAYSKARSGFRMETVSQVGTTDIDKDNFVADNDDYTDIKNLLIDIDTLDNKNFKNFFIESKGLSRDEIEKEFYKQSRIRRFKEAYEKFFPNIKYKGISDPEKGAFNVIFEKNGKVVKLEKLSTGEQQIVCRGARLLKNAKNLLNSIILIDEPELSLHPTWQEKIYDYYCDLFSKNGGNCQLFFATHSEYVIKSALVDPDCLVIILKENQGTIVPHKITCPVVLDTITPSEINYEAFGIYSIDYHIALYAKYQAKVNKEKISETDAAIEAESSYDSSLYGKVSTYVYNGHIITYKTLPTYIRNNIDHPNNGQPFTNEELKKSIEFLRSICR